MRKALGILFLISVAALCYETMVKAQSFDISTDHPGKAVYDANCLSCHQADGRGVPGMNPTLVKTPWVLGNKTQLISIVLKGMTTPLTVNGEQFHNPMPAHTFLTDQQIADVLSYVRSSFGNKASAVKVEEVKKVRAMK
ncbi:MAG: c-type cytochrome [Cytophagaceae bacterium]